MLEYVFLAIFPVKMTVGRRTYLIIALELILYGNCLLHAVAKDLGRKWSYILLTISFVFYACDLLSTIFTDSLDVNAVLVSTEQCVITLVCFIMVKAKYIDKVNRGRKA